MPLIPLIVNQVLNELHRPNLHDQHFGLPLSMLPEEHFSMPFSPLNAGYMRPWRNLNLGVSTVANSGTVSCGKDGFRINLDVQQFKPNELSVKVVDGYVVVEGKHEERSDEHGFISRQFTRRYKIPPGINTDALNSSLTSDGVLQLYAPKLVVEGENERSIPITLTNQPAIKQHAEQNGEPQKKG